MCLIHNWKRMPEPNEIRASIRYCKKCKSLQRFNVHGFHWHGPIPSSGHWMNCREEFGVHGLKWEFIAKYEEPIIEEWISSLGE